MIHILSIKGDGMNNIFTEERDLMFRRRFSYEQFKSAEYIYRLIESKNIIPNQNFFEVLEFLLDDLRSLMKEIIETVKSSPKSSERKNALKVLARTQEWDKSDAVRCFDDILHELPEITGIFRTCLMRRLSDLMKETPYDLQNFMRARRHLKKLFLLNDTMLNVFEFIYIVNNARDTECYLERDIEIWKNQNRNITAEMLGMKTSELNEALRNLLSYGLIEDCRASYEVDSDILPICETPDVHDISRLFCSPLKGKTLPLDMFSISEGDLNYVKKLLTSKMKAPINIMLYGPPGTGKTTFVRSLAKALGMKAFTVNAQDKGSRRAALVACINIASKHKNSFVLVDEAENLLDANRFQCDGKAWLNSFLERYDNKIIWVTNNVSSINPAVKRRFSFSVYFGNLGKRERGFLFRDVIHEHKAERYFDDIQILNLAKNYEVSAGVIDSAVKNAKALRYGKNDFVRAVESSLNAYSRFMHNGSEDVKRNLEVPEGFVTEGITLEGSLDTLMLRCRRADSAMREAAETGNLLSGGCAAMLFYGPPGTGKTALAKYIAHELERECFIVRASDLLDCYVGMTEKKIAGAFSHAEKEGAVLVIDEADTFLYSRDNALRSWEVSEVNEFLTNLEECRCFCICTTNRFKELDSAALRRFSYKVPFTWAKPSQILALYDSLLSPLCDSEIDSETEKELLSLKRLTTGDFHSVRVQFSSFFSDDRTATHEQILSALKREESLKARYIERDIGF